MVSRKQVKDAHEMAVIQQFVDCLNITTSSHFKVVAKPEPPDAVLFDECCSRWGWVEHADVYRTGDEAHEEWSAVAPDEAHYVHQESPICEPDDRFGSALTETLTEKLSKPSYVKAFEAYGPGILVLTERQSI